MLTLNNLTLLRKEKSAVYWFSTFPTMCSVLSKSKIIIWVTLNLPSADAVSLGKSETYGMYCDLSCYDLELKELTALSNKGKKNREAYFLPLDKWDSRL